MRFGLVVAVFGLVGLAGCSGAAPVVSSVGPPISPLSDVALTGVVSSGAQPIVGAHVYLLAANTTGYGGNGIAASSSNASFSLMAAQETKTADSVGAYVMTDANGKFSLTGDYSCSNGQQLYLYALGGNAGSGVDSAAGLMAVVGSCPSSSGPAVAAAVNEGYASTVQPGFIAIDGSGNAWTSAPGVGEVVEVSSSGSIVSGASGYSIVPGPEGISIDASGDAWVAGDSGQNNVGELSNSGAILSGASGYTGGGLNRSIATAVDGAGSVWVTNGSGNTISELSHSGVALSGVSGYGAPSSGPLRVAVDGSGDLWVVNVFAATLTELLGAGTPVITPIAAGLPATPTANGSSNLGTRP